MTVCCTECDVACCAALEICDHLQCIVKTYAYEGDSSGMHSALSKLRKAGLVSAICGLFDPKERTPPDTCIEKPSRNFRVARALATATKISLLEDASAAAAAAEAAHFGAIPYGSPGGATAPRASAGADAHHAAISNTCIK